MLSKQPLPKAQISEDQLPLIVRDLQLGDLAIKQRDIYKEQNVNLKNVIVQQVDTIQTLKVTNVGLQKTAVKSEKKAKRRGKVSLALIVIDLLLIAAIRIL